jgi:hypothetical protein
MAAPFKSNGTARLALVRVFRKVQTTTDLEHHAVLVFGTRRSDTCTKWNNNPQ